MKKIISITCLSLSLLVVGCSKGSKTESPAAPAAPTATSPVPAASGAWAEKDRQDFLTQCTATAKAGVGDKAPAYCDCMLKKIEVKYATPTEAQSLNISDMNAMAKECVK